MLYLLWSREHQGYWKWNRHGYTTDLKEACLFSLEEATQQCADSNLFLSTKPPEELIVPVTDESQVRNG